MSRGSPDARRRGVRVLGLAFLALLILLFTLALGGQHVLTGQPGHYTQQQARLAEMSADQRRAVSASLRNEAAARWSASPDGAAGIDELIGHRSTLVIPFEDLNVWLAEEGIGLLKGVGIELPPTVRGVMIDATDGGLLRITCDLKTDTLEQVVSLAFDLRIGEDGTVVSRLEQAAAGRLPMPRQAAVDLIADRAGSGGGLILDLMDGTPTGPIDLPIDPGRDGLRDGRLVGLEVRNEAMVITRETVRRGSRQ